MKNKKLIIFFSVVILSIMLCRATRINSFFAQFENEMELQDFLLRNLQNDVSSLADVRAFMDVYITRFESCNVFMLSALPRQYEYTLNKGYDDTYVRCTVFTENKWIFDLVEQTYIIHFHFKDDILTDIIVYAYFLGL